jgi:hypothetical protein
MHVVLFLWQFRKIWQPHPDACIVSYFYADLKIMIGRETFYCKHANFEWHLRFYDMRAKIR